MVKKSNKIFCVGLGKLGLIFSFILADKKFRIYGYDVDKKIKKNIDNNKSDTEPHLNRLIEKNKQRFVFESNFNKAVDQTTGVFLIVPTPSKKNDEFDNKYIINCLNKIGPHLKSKKKYLINITSTVNPGSCNHFISYIEKKFNVKHGREFIVTYNPHLIALGSIYNDVLNSDMVIVGSDLVEGHKSLKNIYKKIYNTKIDKLKFLNLRESELTKIAINSYITMKISFTNQISEISDKIKNIDTSKILHTIGFDKRIGHNYLSLGAMFAGPCFPRDNKNFAKFLKRNSITNILPKSVDAINNRQFDRYIKIYNGLKKEIKKNHTIGICGLSYKDNTTLTTHSPGIKLLNYFKNKKNTFVYDSNFNNSNQVNNMETNLKEFFKKSDIIFICYKDKNFKKIELYKTNKKKIIVDLWNYVFSKSKKIIIKKVGIS